MNVVVVLISVLAGFHSSWAQSDTSLTRFALQGDIGLGYNAHAANFRLLDPKYPSCCATFSNGDGIGASFGAAVTYDLTASMGSEPIRIGARLSWTDLSASLIEDEFVSYIIFGNTVADGIARHTISASYGILGIEPFVSARPLASLPLRVRIGGMIGLPMGASFSQQEQLIEPADAGVTFSEGTRTRNVYSGDLPNASTQMFATFALSWPVTMMGGLEVSPELGVMYGLTHLTSTLNWSASSVRLGASFRYVFPKSVPPPPPPPPPPPAAAPRIPTVLSRLEMPTSADTIVLPMLRRTEQRRLFAVPSVMFFERNSTSPLEGASEREKLQQRVIDAVRLAMADDPAARLTIIGSAAADEPAVLARERYAWAIRRLGVDVSRISVKTETPPQPEEPALLDEQRNVTFLINDRPTILTSADATVQISRTPTSINFAHIMTCDTICEESLSVTLNGKPLAVTGKGPAYSVTVDTALLEGGVGTIELRSSAAVGATTSRDRIVRSVVEGIADESVEVRRLDGQQGEDVLTLCYFDFNSSSPKMVNQAELETVRKALRAGATVTLIASTDNIGTEESNRQLAQKRAQSLLTLIGQRSERLLLRIDVTGDDANRSPMNRVTNRSVRAAIAR